MLANGRGRIWLHPLAGYRSSSILFRDPPESPVMIVGVVILAGLAGDDPARPAIPSPRGFDCVFAVITPGLQWQAFFEIAENDAVAFVGEWPAGLDQGQRLPGFGRQICRKNRLDRRI